MNRREALSAVSFLLGGTIIGAEVFLSGCSKSTPASQAGLFSSDSISLLDEIGETILPTTESSPGAKEARVGEFMNVIVTDCYTADEQKIFADGLIKLNDLSKSGYGKDFLSLNSGERHALLLTLEEEASHYDKTKKAEDPAHYYVMIKQLTLWGYFSSEAGATKALRHVAVPGRYEACITLEKGQKAWAL